MLLLCQDMTAQKLADWWHMHPEKFVSMPETINRMDEAQRQALARRYMKLVDALNHFADKYNQNRGSVWPLKEAQAVQKAYREFEHSMPTPKN